MTWWVEPAGDGTVVRYGTGNLGVNGVLWEQEFTVGDWHQLGMHVRAHIPFGCSNALDRSCSRKLPVHAGKRPAARVAPLRGVVRLGRGGRV